MKILWILFVWPEPNSSAAGSRTLKLIEWCKLYGHEVRAFSGCQDNSYRQALESLGIKTEHCEANEAAFNRLIEAYNPDMVFFDRFIIEEQFSFRVRESCPNAIRVLDTVDLHSLRRARQEFAKASRDVSLDENLDLNSEDAYREIASIYRSDLSIIISSHEINLLKEHYNVPQVLLLPCGLSFNRADSILNFEDRQHFVAIGNFNHAPNADSFRILHDFLWERIKLAVSKRSADDVELHIYGAYPTKEIMALDNEDTGFRVKGWAEEAQRTLGMYRVNLAPLRFGAGLKGKIGDGWAVGTPCVTTSIGAEGMQDDLTFGGAVKNNWDLFAEIAAELYCDRSLWLQYQKKGQLILENKFSEIMQRENFHNIFEIDVTEWNRRRQSNFTGNMLWYQGNRSTEYFSRWIEEKSKNR